VLHCLQPANHRLDTRAYLLVLLQEARAFAAQTVEPLPQRPILFPKLRHHRDQFSETLIEQFQFLARRGLLLEFVHGEDYAAMGLAWSNNVADEAAGDLSIRRC
jgi:hypothetical protein